MRLSDRVAVHRALADPHRLQIVDLLRCSDLTPTELRSATGLASNLLAFHLDTLETTGVVTRHSSRGDARRRYVSLRADTIDEALARDVATVDAGPVLFVCTHNAARSQLAAALWRRHGRSGQSAGRNPATRVHPLAVRIGERHGLDLSRAQPRGYDAVDVRPALVVSVCDLAREAEPPFDAPLAHWSIPDPTEVGTLAAFEGAFEQLQHRIERLLGQVAA